MSFEALPPEIVEQVVVLLTLHDIGSVRLASRTLASKATQEHYKSNFYSQSLELTERRLNQFVAVAAFAGLIRLLQHLTIICPVYNTLELEANVKDSAISLPLFDEDGSLEEIIPCSVEGEDLRRIELSLSALSQQHRDHSRFISRREHVALLSQAFRSLTSHGVHLRLLTAEVIVYRVDTHTPILPLYGGGWKRIWAAASTGFEAIFASISTGLTIQHLELFTGIRMLRCSLPCDQFTGVNFDSAQFDIFLGNLESLSMSVSDKVINQSNKESLDLEDYSTTTELDLDATWLTEEDMVLHASNEQNFTGLANMLRKCRNLKSLDFSHFMLDFISPDISQALSDGMLDAIHQAKLESIETLSLEGFDMSESRLLELLRALSRLRKVTLSCVTLLEGGDWDVIFNHCVENMEEACFDSLFQPKVLLFRPPWAMSNANSQINDHIAGLKAHYQRAKDVSRTHKGNIGTAAPTKIEYILHEDSRLRTKAARAWRQDLKNRFGPPGYGGEACVRDGLTTEQIWQLQP